MPVKITGKDLTLADIWNVAYNFETIELDEISQEKVIKCRNYVEKIIKENRVVYGLTTGFGKFSTVRIPADQIEELQENLIISHSTGVGNYLSIPETRAVMLLRINVLARGHSGIRLSTLQTLIDMLNARIHPCIPEKGSVGASGDLAPLSHLALVLLGKGKAEFNGRIISGKLAMKKAGIAPVKLKAKEGLALNNGTQVMTAVGALNLIRARNLVKQADIIAAASIDAMLGTASAFDALVHKQRPHKGQLTSAENLRKLLAESELNCSHENCENVQDAYSIRCTPQVNGAVRDALDYVQSVIEVEINSATDNPLIFPDEDKVISGGNFHGEPVAFALDTLGIVVSELGNIADRRLEHILNPALNRGLNPFLASRPGLDSGFMIAQVTTASLVSENKIHAHPSSVDSVPTSANQEDHVSMGTIGAMKARTIIENVSFILGIELMIAIQALDSRPLISSPPLEAVRGEIRKTVKTLKKDRLLNVDINNMKRIIDSAILIDVVSKFVDLD
ncbi:MAG: histidine ammonia-lyase [Candidatus Cloacimonetes bacterium]|nr:histidine ammonia-lyase [Candidatus Cloacimonadota bacterium]MCF7813033.1 histidine ammonia-lyase [Candidatus Cloacimonadota bacterium]MCF7867226.1 histidine ammonia-lyase [Candidatus Cloacimonadota bacterium]MCF7882670.1 histidine ammonia-lyase [Candidatus Cloacimonadota bacterium]